MRSYIPQTPNLFERIGWPSGGPDASNIKPDQKNKLAEQEAKTGGPEESQTGREKTKKMDRPNGGIDSSNSESLFAWKKSVPENLGYHSSSFL